MGYNIGVVSGLTKPLIQCTLFKESDNIPLDLYIVFRIIVVSYVVGSFYFNHSGVCHHWFPSRCLDFK